LVRPLLLVGLERERVGVQRELLEEVEVLV
jgi:hypothetical protein